FRVSASTATSVDRSLAGTPGAPETEGDGEGVGVPLADAERSPPPSVNRSVVPCGPGTTAAGALGPSLRAIVHATDLDPRETAETSSRSTTIAFPSPMTGAGMPAKSVSPPIPVG